MNTQNTAMKLRTKLGVATTVVIGSIAQAHAALDPAVTAAFTAVTEDVDAMGDLAWPLAVAVTLIGIGIGLFKKFVSKAAS
jgi:hypothetical protein